MRLSNGSISSKKSALISCVGVLVTVTCNAEESLKVSWSTAGTLMISFRYASDAVTGNKQVDLLY